MGSKGWLLIHVHTHRILVFSPENPATLATSASVPFPLFLVTAGLSRNPPSSPWPHILKEVLPFPGKIQAHQDGPASFICDWFRREHLMPCWPMRGGQTFSLLLEEGEENPCIWTLTHDVLVLIWECKDMADRTRSITDHQRLNTLTGLANPLKSNWYRWLNLLLHSQLYWVVHVFWISCYIRKCLF